MTGILQKAIEATLHWQRNAKAEFSGVKVGACVIAKDEDNKESMFSACNVEVSNRKGIHGEQLAAYDAIKHGYKNIHTIVVSSQSVEERAALCDECRGFFAKINPQLRVVVVNPSGSIKLDLRLDRDLRPYSYNG